MFDPAAVSNEIAELRPLARRKFGIKRGRDTAFLKRLRRKLPKTMRTHLDRFTEARKLAASPLLAPRVDMSALETSRRALQEHMRAIDPRALRREMWLDVGATIAINVLIIGALLLAILQWRGFLGS